MKNFGLIGAAGFVAPRHMKAIKETGHQLLAAFDPNDSVGIIDSYFPSAAFFVEFERYDRHVEKLKRKGNGLDYQVICSPNYLHDAHIRFGLRTGSNVICEKPVVLNPWNLDALQEIEEETGNTINCILQMRLHQNAIALKEKYSQTKDEKVEVDLTYITSRGNWYYASWKGEEGKSGGISTNIGVHFFDLLIWIFGPVEQNEVYINEHDRACGYLELKHAKVKWFLSINQETLPASAKNEGLRTFRSLTIGDDQFDFSQGFTHLHTASYEQILTGNGPTIKDASQSIQLVHEVRNAKLTPCNEHTHELAKLPLSVHPFTKNKRI